MPIGPLAAALIQTGTSAGLNIGNQMLQRHWAIKDYERQRQDNLRDFQMANKYNSPAEQMNRLREAGLNPHLVYGKGADQAAVQMKGADLETPKNMAPVAAPDLVGVLQAKSALNYQKAQTDNVLQDTRNKEVQSRLMELQVLNQNITNSKDALQLQQNKEIYDAAIQKYKNEVALQELAMDQGKLKMFLDLSVNEREELNAVQNRAESVQRIAESKRRMLQMSSQIQLNTAQRGLIAKQIQQLDAVINLTKSQQALADADLKLRKWGVTPNDPWYIRGLAALGKNPNANREEVEREINRAATLEESSDNKYGHGAVLELPFVPQSWNDWLNSQPNK